MLLTYATVFNNFTASPKGRLKPECILKIALALDVSVDYLLGHENGGQRKGGPVGKPRCVFEEASKLPWHRRGPYHRSACPKIKRVILA
jgi:hypothetical protein